MDNDARLRLAIAKSLIVNHKVPFHKAESMLDTIERELKYDVRVCVVHKHNQEQKQCSRR